MGGAGLGILVAALWAGIVAWLIARAALQYRAYEVLAPQPLDTVAPDVTVIVPARNEAAGIGVCLAALSGQDYPRDQMRIVMVDDGSTDATVALARAAAARDPRITVLAAPPLPAGWTGKAHACWRGAAAASTRWLCFIDADTVPLPALLRSAIARAERDGVDFLSLEPRQELVTVWERLILPAGLCALGFVGNLRQTSSGDSEQAAANGQFILMRREIYERVGGHRAVRGTVAEDSALARRVKAANGRLALFGGAPVISVRMYRDLPHLWEGLAKNVTETFGGVRATAMIVALGLIAAWAAVAVPLALSWTLLSPATALGGVAVLIAVLASLAIAGMHVAAARYFAIPLWYGLVFPIGYTLAALLAIDGIAARRRGRIAWKGRLYPVLRGGDAGPPPS